MPTPDEPRITPPDPTPRDPDPGSPDALRAELDATRAQLALVGGRPLGAIIRRFARRLRRALGWVAKLRRDRTLWRRSAEGWAERATELATELHRARAERDAALAQRDRLDAVLTEKVVRLLQARRWARAWRRLARERQAKVVQALDRAIAWMMSSLRRKDQRDQARRWARAWRQAAHVATWKGSRPDRQPPG